MPVDFPGYNLGRIKPQTAEAFRGLNLADYVTSEAAAVPASRMWLPGIPYGFMGNDTLNDCVEAAMGHAIQIFTYDARPPASPAGSRASDATIEALYSTVTGYVPGNPATDVGSTIDAGLAYWQVQGIAGHKLTACPFIISYQTGLIRQAINWFGLIDIGVELPISAQAQIGGIWDVPPGGATGDGAVGSWGGHSFVVGGFDATYLYGVPWNGIQRMTWAFFATYCDQVYALVDKDWLMKSGKTPSGLNLAQLLADAKTI